MLGPAGSGFGRGRRKSPRRGAATAGFIALTNAGGAIRRKKNTFDDVKRIVEQTPVQRLELSNLTGLFFIRATKSADKSWTEVTSPPASVEKGNSWWNAHWTANDTDLSKTEQWQGSHEAKSADWTQRKKYRGTRAGKAVQAKRLERQQKNEWRRKFSEKSKTAEHDIFAVDAQDPADAQAQGAEASQNSLSKSKSSNHQHGGAGGSSKSSTHQQGGAAGSSKSSTHQEGGAAGSTQAEESSPKESGPHPAPQGKAKAPKGRGRKHNKTVGKVKVECDGGAARSSNDRSPTQPLTLQVIEVDGFAQEFLDEMTNWDADGYPQEW